MRYLALIPALLAFASAVAAWRQSRRPIPRYVHLIALAAAGLGIWLAWLDVTVGEFRWDRAVLLVGITPALVYWGYLVYAAKWGRFPPPEAVDRHRDHEA